MTLNWKLAEKKTTINYWKPVNEGDFVEGEVVAIKEGNFEKMNYYLQQFDGSGVVVVNGTAQLELLMKDNNITVGSKIRVEYKGTKDIGKGNDMKVFELYIGE